MNPGDFEPDFEPGSKRDFEPPVSAPDALAELTELLGVEVVDVQRVCVRRGGRPQPDPNAWRLTIPGREWDDNPVLTRDFRAEWSLNWRARILGRSPDLPPLTKEDGRRALRLMHEAVEANAADSQHDTDSTTDTEGINR